MQPQAASSALCCNARHRLMGSHSGVRVETIDRAENVPNEPSVDDVVAGAVEMMMKTYAPR